LHLLVELTNHKNYENYHYYDNYSCGNYWPCLDEDGNTIIGDMVNPLFEYAFNRIDSHSSILNSTRFNYRQEPIEEIPNHPGNAIIKAENEIILSSGFFAEKGSTLLATIDPHIFWGNEFKNNNILLVEHPQNKSLEIDSDKQYVGSNLNLINDNLILYPNPFNDNIFIINGKVGMNYYVKDLFNRILSNGVIQTEKFSVNLSFLPCGMYILCIANGQLHYNYKIVKK